MCSCRSIDPQQLETWLDQALELDPEALSVWLGSLPQDQARRIQGILALEQRQGPLDRVPAHLAAEACATLDAEPIPSVDFGAYTVTGFIGSGGMATAWRAERSDGVLVRTMAVECPKHALAIPDLRRRFLREQRILARLMHPSNCVARRPAPQRTYTRLASCCMSWWWGADGVFSGADLDKLLVG